MPARAAGRGRTYRRITARGGASSRGWGSNARPRFDARATYSTESEEEIPSIDPFQTLQNSWSEEEQPAPPWRPGGSAGGPQGAGPQGGDKPVQARRRSLKSQGRRGRGVAEVWMGSGNGPWWLAKALARPPAEATWTATRFAKGSGRSRRWRWRRWQQWQPNTAPAATTRASPSR